MFIGRLQELKQLDHASRDKKSHFTILYGRRRIGKSELIKRHCQKKRSFIYNALDTTRKRQIKNFLYDFSKFIGDPLIASAPLSSWREVFDLVEVRIPKKKFVFVLDELQWMCKADKSLLSVIQHVWDHAWQHHNRIHLVLCGSSTSFMLSEVLSQKSPLFGRRTETIELGPLPPPEAEKILRVKNNIDAATYLICFGAVPGYLQLYDNHQSLEQNINKLAFCHNSYFIDELRYILSGQLKQPLTYYKILRILSLKSLSLAELSRLTHISTGTLIYNVERLKELKIIEEHRPILAPENAKTVCYKIVDEYIRFFFAFIYPHLQMIKQNTDQFFFDKIVAGKWDSFLDRAFEVFCHKNLGMLLTALGIWNVFGRSGMFWHKKTVTKGPGVQIDLVIERNDRTTLIGKCKWSRHKIGYEIIKELDEKCRRYPNSKKHKLRKLLITSGGVTHNLVDHPELDVVTIDDFFR